MKYSRFLGIGLLLLLRVARVFAADITGTWKASFDTQVGQQNDTYQFEVKGTTLTGKIQSDMGGTSEVLQGKVEGDKVSFVETLKFEGNEIQITYTGQVTSADEIKFTRLRQPEVEHLHRAVAAYLDVGGLEIPMDDAEVVRGLESFRNLFRDRQCFVEGNRSTSDPLRQILALDQFHDERAHASAFFEAVDRRQRL